MTDVSFPEWGEPSGWRPISTLPARIDTKVILWNPCDGIHLPDPHASQVELEDIRNGKIYSHWRRVAEPR